ncbi:MAG: DNA alkylation repair protein [Polyangiaceae bacterium]
MTRSSHSALQRTVREALLQLAEPARAPAMQAYMKSDMPYLGVSAARVKAACRAAFAAYPFESAQAWRDDVLFLWRGAKHREERYAALSLSGQRKAQGFQNLAALPMYEELIVTGAWWDYVDELAEHRIGPLLAAYPVPMRKKMLVWSRSSDMWKRRTSIICQMFFREATDLQLLFSCIEPSLSSKEFFLRKAIGWALRQLAKHDPNTVRRYVEEHSAQLSPLSRREALKHLSAGK